RSARYFNFTLPINLIKKELLYLAGIHSKNSYKVRLTVNYLGKYNIEIEQIQPVNSIKNISLAKQPINSKYPFLYHKTTWREVYEKRRLNDCSFDTLLWNDNKQLTEFTIGNLVVQKNQKLFTPPINSGLLNGTYRASLIDTKIIEEK